MSKFLRKNLILMHREGGYLLFHFDSDADYYPGIDAVDFKKFKPSYIRRLFSSWRFSDL